MADRDGHLHQVGPLGGPMPAEGVGEMTGTRQNYL